MMKLGSGGMQGKYSEGRAALICTPRCVPLLLKAKPFTRFRERLLAGPSRDGVSLEYASWPTKTSSSQTSSTTPSRHPAINHNCPPRPYIFILLPRMAIRRVPDLPCTFVFLPHVPFKAMTSLCRSTTPLRHFTPLPNLPRRSLLQPIPRALFLSFCLSTPAPGFL